MSKYGPPVKCDICLQTCAFNRSELRIDGKLHCWLCKLSYKRALAKAKRNDEKNRDRGKKRPTGDDDGLKTGPTMIKMSNQSSSSRNHQQRDLSKTTLSEIPEKIQKTSANSGVAPSAHSDHVVAITQLREQIASLQKKLNQKDSQLLKKDKEVSDLSCSCPFSCLPNFLTPDDTLFLSLNYCSSSNVKSKLFVISNSFYSLDH
jgi:hypothetical protein